MNNESGMGLADDCELPVEIVHLYVYDIGRAVDLKKAAALLPEHAELPPARMRNTPSSLTLPKPLVFTLDTRQCNSTQCNKFTAYAKMYDDGALTLAIRYQTRSRLTDLAGLENIRVGNDESSPTVKEYIAQRFSAVCAIVREAVSGFKDNNGADKETYTAFCLLKCPDDNPAAFVERNRDVVASLISGESPGILHESQIAQTLAKPFSYRKDDLAIFDMDRCLIVDSERDYEDLLLIAEHANYRLNELRVLDGLLDSWLDEAEKDIRSFYLSGGTSRPETRRLRLKLARIQTLRFDALFTLENLDNSSKIIGDYFLGLVYDRLCAIFNTEGWKVSVSRRLEALQNLYEMIKTDTGERRMVMLDIIFIIVCIILPIMQILQVMFVAAK